MKALANKARVEMVNTGRIAYDKTARDTYSAEVKSLMDKLNTAEINTPRERAAQRIANVEVKAKKEAYERENGEKMKKGDIKKISQQALSKARTNVASVSRRDRAIEITDKEWEAIQAGAISESKLKQILDNTNIDSLRARATPRTTVNLSSAKINQIKSMSASNYTLAEIANKLGVSTSTVSKYL
jgi:predicted DNA binding protein